MAFPRIAWPYSEASSRDASLSTLSVSREDIVSSKFLGLLIFRLACLSYDCTFDRSYLRVYAPLKEKSCLSYLRSRMLILSLLSVVYPKLEIREIWFRVPLLKGLVATTCSYISGISSCAGYFYRSTSSSCRTVSRFFWQFSFYLSRSLS